MHEKLLFIIKRVCNVVCYSKNTGNQLAHVDYDAFMTGLGNKNLALPFCQ